MTYAEMKGLGYGTVNERLGKVPRFYFVITLACAGPAPPFGLWEAVDSFAKQFGRSGSALLVLCDSHLHVQDAVGNYYDCRLTLRPAVVSAAVTSLTMLLPAMGSSAMPWWLSTSCLGSCASWHDSRHDITLTQHKILSHCVWAVQDPVCTPDGYMFSREAILENLLQQKKANKRKYAAWEAQQQDEQRKVRNQEKLIHSSTSQDTQPAFV